MRRALTSVLGGGFGLTAVVALAWAAADQPTKFASIDQNVDQATLDRYHYTDQGNRLIPAAWLEALVGRDGKRVMDTETLRRQGFLVDNVVRDGANPYGWPLGFTVSLPERSPAGIPFAGLTCAMCHTGQIDFGDTAIRIEGGQAMIDLAGFGTNVLGALVDLTTDPARREAFTTDAVKAGYPTERIQQDLDAAVEAFARLGSTNYEGLHSIVAGRGRYDALQGGINQVFSGDIGVPSNARTLDAPVNYPHLWDIWRLSWLQYNGMAPPGSTSRNLLETVGTRAITNIINPRTGELNPEPLRWQTSVQLDNLIWMEEMLERLTPPTWPADILGALDQAKVEAGHELFATNCSGCHGIKELPNGDWDVTVVPLTDIGTDPAQATDWAGRTYDATKLGLSAKATARDAAAAVNAIRRQLYVDYKIPASEQQGDVAIAAPCGYKARPLVGVWATPPFLHNGSVRTVFDLLSDTRPSDFRFGTRQFDPIKLGYTEDESLGDTVLDTTIPGNSNQGHWWTDDMARPGRIGPKLSDDGKYAIIEYLKAATYENYPREERSVAAGLPCDDTPNWAVEASTPSP